MEPTLASKGSTGWLCSLVSGMDLTSWNMVLSQLLQPMTWHISMKCKAFLKLRIQTSLELASMSVTLFGNIPPTWKLLRSSLLFLIRCLHQLSTAIPRPDTSPLYFKPGKLPDIPLVCSMKECVGSSLCSDDVGDFYSKKTLAVLVWVKSYLLFKLLKIEDLSWLEATVAIWKCFPSYIQARDFVSNLEIPGHPTEQRLEVVSPSFFGSFLISDITISMRNILCLVTHVS